MTLVELQAETLVQKHTRLMQEKCQHEDTYSSTVYTPRGSSVNRLCFDCGKSWHSSTIEIP